MDLRNNKLGIKENQIIKFRHYIDDYTSVYTKKVQEVVIQSFNGLTHYNVNQIGCGVGFSQVEPEDIIK